MQVFITFAQVTGGGATGRAYDDNNPHSLQMRWKLPTDRRRVAHSVIVTYGPLCMFLWLYWYATIVEKITTITCNTFNQYGSVAPWVRWGGICRVDIPAAGCAFCDSTSDLRAVMHVCLAFWIRHDRWKGHHNYMQQIQSIWQRSAMGQLRWNLPSWHTGGGSRILWQWLAGRYAFFSGFFDPVNTGKRPMIFGRKPRFSLKYDWRADFVCVLLQF